MKRCSHFDGGHNGLFTDAKQYDESVRLITAFLREYLAK
jgi:hypothetical protein